MFEEVDYQAIKKFQVATSKDPPQESSDESDDDILVFRDADPATVFKNDTGTNTKGTPQPQDEFIFTKFEEIQNGAQ